MSIQRVTIHGQGIGLFLEYRACIIYLIQSSILIHIYIRAVDKGKNLTPELDRVPDTTTDRV